MLESPEWISKASSWFAMNAKEAGRRLQLTICGLGQHFRNDLQGRGTLSKTLGTQPFSCGNTNLKASFANNSH
jgi:hypothetical protein